MDFPVTTDDQEDGDAVIVKADEVDESGADISTISPTDASESEFNARIETRRAHDSKAGGSPKILANAVPSPPRVATRPILRREGSAPAPPEQAPPAVPSQSQEESSGPTDSLSLQQLKRLVTDLPKHQPTAYAYEYSETRSFPEEIEEWFSYTEDDRSMLNDAKQTFDDKWTRSRAKPPERSDTLLGWTDVEPRERESFVMEALDALDSSDYSTRLEGLECVSYICLGAWGETAGVEDRDESFELTVADTNWIASHHSKPKVQIHWILNGIRMLYKLDAVQKLLNVLTKLSDNEQGTDASGDELPALDKTVGASRSMRRIEMNRILTCLYIIVEASRSLPDRAEQLVRRQGIENVRPSILLVLCRMISSSRWEEHPCIPLLRVVLLLWKSTLLLFGSFQDLHDSKAMLRRENDVGEDEHDESFITASPLDYHLFRQEITSKYPAYNPPPPLVPLEEQNNSILPPLTSQSSKQASQNNIEVTNVNSINGTGGSIFHQPVHIATPAPSPPPSPGGPGGKGGKKQNYQTNQNFPFLYPPLDLTSNNMGAKGNTELQDQLINRRWKGSGVPASILEAGQLFASRMRMSRSIRQLWDVREKYIKYERGWNGLVQGDRSGTDSDSENEDGHERVAVTHEGEEQDNRISERETDNEDLQRRLDTIDRFYRDVLPDLQSIVMVFWRLLVENVTTLVVRNGQNGMPNGLPEDGDAAGRKRMNPGSSVNLNGMQNGQTGNHENSSDPVLEELDGIRTREIASKAVSGVLLTLLKWFKLSHILKYEYLTQLLLDANYLPLILKFFAHQDVDRAVDQRNDRSELDLFHFCHLNSSHPPSSSPQPALSPPSSSEDEAAPPPILKHRRSPTSQSPPPTPPPPVVRPEVDELGYPTSGALPQTPLTDFAPRFFLTNINLLRIIQKISKRKAHRALLLVQYKSSTILRKALKIPQPDLRLYTLKPFKSLVPYCGRKWRQTNMRVITAIYLHCRPELRDEWLCGADVDGAIEEAVPLEQAGRSLVHWWHLREFKDAMEDNENRIQDHNDALDNEHNFFARELERMGWGPGGVGTGEEEEGQRGVDVPPAVPNEFEGGPLAMEGWA